MRLLLLISLLISVGCGNESTSGGADDEERLLGQGTKGGGGKQSVREKIDADGRLPEGLFRGYRNAWMAVEDLCGSLATLDEPNWNATVEVLLEYRDYVSKDSWEGLLLASHISTELVKEMARLVREAQWERGMKFAAKLSSMTYSLDRLRKFVRTWPGIDNSHYNPTSYRELWDLADSLSAHGDVLAIEEAEKCQIRC